MKKETVPGPYRRLGLVEALMEDYTAMGLGREAARARLMRATPVRREAMGQWFDLRWPEGT